MQKTLAYLAIVLVFILGVVSGCYLRSLRPIQPDVSAKPDTVYVDTTIYVDRPVPVSTVPIGYELVPIGTVDRITQQIHTLEDSLERKPKVVYKDSVAYIDVPIEQKHYGDSTYDAWVSGYKPTLDSLRFNQQNAIIKVPVYKTVSKRWGVGFQGGVTYISGKGLTPYVGAGVSYNIICF